MHCNLLTLIGAASLGTDYALASGVQKVAAQTTILAAPPIAPQGNIMQSQVYTEPVTDNPVPSVNAQPVASTQPLTMSSATTNTG